MFYSVIASHQAHYKPTGKLIYFDRSELDDWLLQNKTYNEIKNNDENK